MNTNQLQDEILAIIRTVFEDKKSLQKIHTYLMDEIYKEPEPIRVADKYKKVIKTIAENLLSGLVCFFNPYTLEVEDMPKELAFETGGFEMMTGETFESSGLKHQNWNKCIIVEPMESHDSFKVMENFVDEISDASLQNKLVNALNNRKPFANFKHIVENSFYRQEWFDYRQKQWEYYVWKLISIDLEEEESQKN
jgi:hypothetical protein